MTDWHDPRRMKCEPTIRDYFIGLGIGCAFVAYLVFVVGFWPGISANSRIRQRHQWAIDAGRARWVSDEKTGQKNFEWLLDGKDD